jgi:hypothetical protein
MLPTEPDYFVHGFTAVVGWGRVDMSRAVVDHLLLGRSVGAHDAGAVVGEGVVDWRFVGDG